MVKVVRRDNGSSEVTEGEETGVGSREWSVSLEDFAGRRVGVSGQRQNPTLEHRRSIEVPLRHSVASGWIQSLRCWFS